MNNVAFAAALLAGAHGLLVSRESFRLVFIGNMAGRSRFLGERAAVMEAAQLEIIVTLALLGSVLALAGGGLALARRKAAPCFLAGGSAACLIAAILGQKAGCALVWGFFHAAAASCSYAGLYPDGCISLRERFFLLKRANVVTSALAGILGLLLAVVILLNLTSRPSFPSLLSSPVFWAECILPLLTLSGGRLALSRNRCAAMILSLAAAYCLAWSAYGLAGQRASIAPQGMLLLFFFWGLWSLAVFLAWFDWHVQRCVPPASASPVSPASSASPAPAAPGLAALVRQGQELLGRGEFDEAARCFDGALALDMRSSNAYLGRLMAARRARNANELVAGDPPLEEEELFQSALRSAGPKMKELLDKYVAANRARLARGARETE